MLVYVHEKLGVCGMVCVRERERVLSCLHAWLSALHSGLVHMLCDQAQCTRSAKHACTCVLMPLSTLSAFAKKPSWADHIS